MSTSSLKKIAVELFWLNASRIKLNQDIESLKKVLSEDLLWPIIVNWTINEKNEHGGSLEHLTKAMNAKDSQACHDYLTKILADNHVTPTDFLPNTIEFPNPKECDNFFLANRSLFQLLDKYVNVESG